MTVRDSRIFCRCGLMWNNAGACSHCDEGCGIRSCPRCSQYDKQATLDAHRSRIQGA